MATVLLNRTLKQFIERKIEDLFSQRQKKLMEELQTKAQALIAEYVEKETSPIAKLVAAHPELDVFMLKNVEFQAHVSDKERNIFLVSWKSQKPFYKHMNWGSMWKIPQDSVLYIEMMAMLVQKVSLIKEKEALIKELYQLMNAAPSLQALVKVWPSVLEYCPPETIKKLSAPNVVRVKKNTLEVSTIMKVGLVRAKILATTSAIGATDEQPSKT
jgi:hypothetical protein